MDSRAGVEPQPSLMATGVQVVMVALATVAMAVVLPAIIGFGLMTGCDSATECRVAEVAVVACSVAQWAIVVVALGLTPWAWHHGWDRRRLHRAAWLVTVSAMMPAPLTIGLTWPITGLVG